MKSIGYFGGLDLDYKDRYILDGLVRRDGSSLFGRRTAGAHSAADQPRGVCAGAVVVHSKINELKLRASIGTAGNRPPFVAQYETFH